ncbi:cytochrome P450 [Heliocybe sulcata]|uniref:Cytochrome P450 n=1 Tax=Heliocybe sulcata TaxID=5364 RepID=A0A5C3MNI1_9AGAM|nr:cytochrome P450 [Heliocybe sulcata]
MFLAKVFLSAVAAGLAYVLWRIASRLIRPAFSPLRNLPGPPNPSLLLGHAKQLMKGDSGEQVGQWAEQYGHVFKFKLPLNSDRLVILDTKAIHHILSHSYDYPKPEGAHRSLSRIFGAGLILVEGMVLLNPAFGPVHLRGMTSIFFDKATQLRDIWLSQLPASGEPVKLDALGWLSKVALDIIGLAGFGYDFEALISDRKPNELNEAFDTVLHGGPPANSLRSILQLFTGFGWLEPAERRRQIQEARRTLDRIGRQLLEERKNAVRESMSGAEKLEKRAFQGRDLLSLLVKANMAEDIPERERLTDAQVLAQVPTFVIAGHDSTSTGHTWCLYALSLNQSAQSKLRSEIHSVSSDTPSMEELNNLPYLDAVVRETMRVHPPVPMTVRVATKDDVIPLNKPFVNRKGTEQSTFAIAKGENITLPIDLIGRSKDIWGDDAEEFRPERWLSHDIPEAATSVPGIWGNSLAFLGGPRACIGYRFSVLETKAIIFTIIRAFEVELAVPKEDVGKRSIMVTKPLLLSDPTKGNQLPLLVRAVKQ